LYRRIHHISITKKHVNREIDVLLSRDCYWEEEIEDWLKYLRENEDEQIIKNLKKWGRIPNFL